MQKKKNKIFILGCMCCRGSFLWENSSSHKISYLFALDLKTLLYIAFHFIFTTSLSVILFAFSGILASNES